MAVSRQCLVFCALSVFITACSETKPSLPTAPTPAQPTAAASPSTVTVLGTVWAVPRGATTWTPGTSRPVEGVLVEEANSHQSATTDARGMFSLAAISGPLAITLSKSGYFTKMSTLPPGISYVEMPINPIPATFTLSGVVFEITATGRTPVEGVFIEGYDVAATRTDRNGFYTVPAYEGLNYLFVSKEGYQTDPPQLPNCESCNVAVTINGDTRVDIQLVRQ
jgi:hypothetical protein